MSAQTNKPIIAVVDDEPGQRQLLRGALEHAGFAVMEGENGLQGVTCASHCNLMLMDVRMPVMDGLNALRLIHEQLPRLPIILLTAFIDVRDAVAAMKMGAVDYLEKPIDLDELITVIEDTLDIHVGGHEALPLPPGLIAESEAMRQALCQAHKVGATDATVLILGESGCGKEVVAKYIHQTSPRASAPFVAVDCGALPENLVEAELFGHERGAYTGADTAREGRFSQAHGGTIFLDEVGDLLLPLQPKLLRVLETGTFRPIGSEREQHADARVIAATNRDIAAAVLAGNFREDLFYRLNVFPITVPPLRARREDIPALADFFLRASRKTLSPATERLVLAYDWPGNVRELRNAMERAAILTDGKRIMPEALPPVLRTISPPAGPVSVLVGDMAAIERRAIQEALGKTGGNKTQAAQLLGISRRSLIYKLKAFEVNSDPA